MFGLASQSHLDVLDEFFNEFVQLATGKKNRVSFDKKSGNSNVDAMLSKWQAKCNEMDKTLKSDMNVIGEVVLTMDKVEQCIYGCRI